MVGRQVKRLINNHVLRAFYAVHLIGLDSAWLCGDDHDAEKLDLKDPRAVHLLGVAARYLGSFHDSYEQLRTAIDLAQEDKRWAEFTQANLELTELRIEKHEIGYAETSAEAALRVGLGINAGHDLNRDNLSAFLRAVPGVLEVSIGHALVADALELGLAETVRDYQRGIRRAEAPASGGGGGGAGPVGGGTARDQKVLWPSMASRTSWVPPLASSETPMAVSRMPAMRSRVPRERSVRRRSRRPAAKRVMPVSAA